MHCRPLQCPTLANHHYSLVVGGNILVTAASEAQEGMQLCLAYNKVDPPTLQVKRLLTVIAAAPADFVASVSPSQAIVGSAVDVHLRGKSDAAINDGDLVLLVSSSTVMCPREGYKPVTDGKVATVLPLSPTVLKVCFKLLHSTGNGVLQTSPGAAIAVVVPES